MIKYAIFYTMLLLLLPALFAAACKLAGCSFKNGNLFCLFFNIFIIFGMAAVSLCTYDDAIKVGGIIGLAMRIFPVLITAFWSLGFCSLYLMSAMEKEEESEVNYEKENI